MDMKIGNGRSSLEWKGVTCVPGFFYKQHTGHGSGNRLGKLLLIAKQCLQMNSEMPEQFLSNLRGEIAGSTFMKGNTQVFEQQD